MTTKCLWFIVHFTKRLKIILLNFHTTNLNKRLYRRLIENQLLHLGVGVYDFISSWDIHFYSLAQTESSFFDHVKTTSGQAINPNMPSGVTGQKEIRFWLHDSENDFKNRENSDRVQHEVCHAVLFDKYGTQGGTWVNGVHQETKRFTIKFWYWHKFFWRRFQLSVIDIRKLL